VTTPDYVDLLVRGGGIALATYAIIGQVVKPGLRILAKYHSQPIGKLTKGQEEFYRWLTRCLCVVIGGFMGLMPLWPDWFDTSWGPIIGCISGSMSPGIYLAVSKALPDRIKKLISGASVSGGTK
jgi:hypothetical protein